MAVRAFVLPMIYDALKAEGYELPRECCDVRLEMPIDGVFRLHYTVYVRDEDLAKVGRALTRLAEWDSKQALAHQTVAPGNDGRD